MIPMELQDAVDQYCKEHDIPKQQVLEDALFQYLASNGVDIEEIKSTIAKREQSQAPK